MVKRALNRTHLWSLNRTHLWCHQQGYPHIYKQINSLHNLKGTHLWSKKNKKVLRQPKGVQFLFTYTVVYATVIR